jgi:hypothetical protein
MHLQIVIPQRQLHVHQRLGAVQRSPQQQQQQQQDDQQDKQQQAQGSAEA